MKGLRGTPLDPFGRTEVRRAERQLLADYLELVERLLPKLATDPDECARVAGLVDQVRGYEDVKLRNLAAYRQSLAAAGY
jgi:indolepyruvate ferredoxin oxidoreductase